MWSSLISNSGRSTSTSHIQLKEDTRCCFQIRDLRTWDVRTPPEHKIIQDMSVRKTIWGNRESLCTASLIRAKKEPTTLHLKKYVEESWMAVAVISLSLSVGTLGPPPQWNVGPGVTMTSIWMPRLRHDTTLWSTLVWLTVANSVLHNAFERGKWRVWANSPQPGNANANVTFDCHSLPNVTFAFPRFRAVC